MFDVRCSSVSFSIRLAALHTRRVNFSGRWRRSYQRDRVFSYFMVMSTNHVPKETIKRYYRVDRREIAFLRFIFEAYDGLAMIETLNPESGVIVFYIAPGCESDVDMILRDLKGDIMMEAIQV